LGELEPHVLDAMRSADCLLVDGTFWQHDEMARAGISQKLALDMGHLPQSEPGGMQEALESMSAVRKILIHINNTNPILDESSAERKTLDAAGIEVSFDGMEIEL
jgi:pyrroloquinoline quinone biosynthesis protein B